MKYAVSARITAEVCLALLIYSLFSPAGETLWLGAVFAAALLICGLAAERFDRAILRLLCCLPAALIPAAAVHFADLILLAVCWLYGTVRLVSGRFAVKYWVYRRKFILLLLVSLPVSVLIALDLLPLRVPPAAIGFAVAALLLGIYSLRRVRHGIETAAGWSAYSALELLLPLGVGVGLSSLLWLFFQGGYYALEWLAGLLDTPPVVRTTEAPSIPSLTWNRFEPPKRSSHVVQNVTAELRTTTAPPEETESVARRIPPYVWLAIILAVAALTVLTVILPRLKKRAALKSKTAGEEDPEIVRGRRTKGGTVSPARRIRAAYRGYLRFLKQKGQDIRVSDTSQEVLAGSVIGGGEEEELRRLYLSARYGGGSAVTEADADRAESILESILGSKKQ